MSIATELPAKAAKVHTPSDVNKIQYDYGAGLVDVICRGISVGVAGTIAFKDKAGNSFITTSLAAGVVHPISAAMILSTGTTATGITVYW